MLATAIESKRQPVLLVELSSRARARGHGRHSYGESIESIEVSARAIQYTCPRLTGRSIASLPAVLCARPSGKKPCLAFWGRGARQYQTNTFISSARFCVPPASVLLPLRSNKSRRKHTHTCPFQKVQFTIIMYVVQT